VKKIIISEFLDTNAIAQTSKGYSVIYDPDLVDKADELKILLQDAQALVVRNRTQVSSKLLDSAPDLKVVGRLGVGLDNIDLHACKKRGIAVCPATGANDASVAEWAITSIMMLFRGAFFTTPMMLEGKWPRTESMGAETAGKSLGLIGFGAIAKETAKRAQSLGIKTMTYDPYIPTDDSCLQQTRKIEDLYEMLQLADAVSLHVPLTKNTTHLINAEAISNMKTGSILVNAARGGIVDEKALVAAIKSGHLGGAAMDVFENEPLTKNGAALFRDVPNLILTPHIAGVTIESNKRVSLATMENVIAVLEKSQ